MVTTEADRIELIVKAVGMHSKRLLRLVERDVKERNDVAHVEFVLSLWRRTGTRGSEPTRGKY